jgi:hypothetical protein
MVLTGERTLSDTSGARQFCPRARQTDADNYVYRLSGVLENRLERAHQSTDTHAKLRHSPGMPTAEKHKLFEWRVSVHRDLMNKIPTRCSNSILIYFPLFSTLHVSGVTITHHQELPLYIRLCYNNINRSLAERSVCQNRVGGRSSPPTRFWHTLRSAKERFILLYHNRMYSGIS